MQPIKPFSEIAYLQLLQSDLIFPSSYKNMTTSKEINILFEKREEKGVFHKLILPMRAMSCVISMVAIQLIIAPAGVLNHSVKALANYTTTWWKTSYNHYAASSSASNHLQAAGWDLLISISLVSLVVVSYCPAIVTDLPFLFSQSCLAGFWSLSPLVDVELSNLGLLSGDSKSKIYPHLFYKWEFGVDYSPGKHRPLEYISKQVQTSLVQQTKILISEVINSLKDENLKVTLPAELEAKVVLDWIEHYREALTRAGKWEKIEPLRTAFIEANLRVKILHRYDGASSISWENKRINQFKEITAEWKELKIYIQNDSSISALSLSLFKKMMNSDFFNLSKFEMRFLKSKKSLELSLKNQDIFENRIKIDRKSHQIKRTLQIVARCFGIMAICLASPVGALYHAAQAMKFLIYHCREGKNSSYENTEKFKAHSWALLTDLWIAGGICYFMAAAYVIHFVIAKEILAGVFSAGLLWYAKYPESLISQVTYQDERAPLFKAIKLKTDFGLVENSGLLHYNRKIDSTLQTLPLSSQRLENVVFDKWLFDKWEKLGISILAHIACAQTLLGELGDDKKLKHSDIFISDNGKRKLNFEGILKIFAKAYEIEEIHNEKKSERSSDPSALMMHNEKKKGGKWIGDFKRILSQFKEIKSILTQNCTIHYNSFLFSAGNFVPEFPLSDNLLNEVIGEILGKKEILNIDLIVWEEKWKMLRKNFQELKPEQIVLNASPEYQKLREMVKNKEKLMPWEVFEFTSQESITGNEKDYKNKLKKYLLKIHPDKLGVEFKEEATILFRIVDEAKKFI